MTPRYRPGYISEDKVEAYLVKKIKGIGGDCIKGNPHNQRGMPDRICILPNGLIVFVEVKKPGCKPRPNQRLMINRFRSLGHQAVWVNSFAMIDTLANWCSRIMKTTTIVDIGRVCTRPNCKRRVKIPWTNYLQSTNFCE